MGTICIDVPGDMNLQYEIENTETIEKIVRLIKGTGIKRKKQQKASNALSQCPLKQHPKLMGVKILEDPTAPLSNEIWPDTLR